MAVLKVTRDRAEELIDQQISDGIELLTASNRLKTEHEFKNWQHERSRWRDYTRDVLRLVFVDDDFAIEFENSGRMWAVVGGLQWPEYAQQDHSRLQNAVNKVISIRERLTLAEEPSSADPLAASDQLASAEGAVIFLVHGHNVAVREEVARFLDTITEHQHEVVILHEKTSRGRTLIEKFEAHAGQAKYAVALLTGDDVGGPVPDDPSNRPDLNQRARQNVVFELGFFFGKLGRANVAVLYEPQVEKPSDVDGLVYIGLGGSGWKLELGRELRDAGLHVDLNLA